MDSVVSYINMMLEKYAGCKCIIIGDFNFECSLRCKGFNSFKKFTDSVDVVNCDDINSSSVGYTYIHESLNHRSLIDHVFMSKTLKGLVINHTILDEGDNTSDHLPVSFKIRCNLSRAAGGVSVKNEVPVYRWDKGDVYSYNVSTGILLDRLYHPQHCLECEGNCPVTDHHMDIDIYLAEIVHCLTRAADLYIPKVKKSVYKHYWSSALNDLKQESIAAHGLWKSAGKPPDGFLFNLKKNAKYRYKLAIRDSARAAEEEFSDDMYESLCNKEINQFWKTWKNKTRVGPPAVSMVDGTVQPREIADKFANYFKQNYGSASIGLLEPNNDYPLTTNYETKKWLFNLNDVCIAMKGLQIGKSAGEDRISPEHIKFAHDSLAKHLLQLFNMIMCHGYVPKSFGSGIIIPILKDKHSDTSILENYRGITLSSVISKLFETCLTVKFNTYLVSNDLQFGFKKGYGCHHAVYVMQTVTDYFRNRGSCVYIAALDASKAFDKLNHRCLVRKMLQRGIPQCFICVLTDWYTKLTSVVRWQGMLSTSFSINAGVRQGGVLSPVLFNLYMDDMIEQLKESGYGCYINRHFFGCIMYADDILLLSASVTGLQKLLDLSYKYSSRVGLTFNANKSNCVMVGVRRNTRLPDMFIGDKAVAWSLSLKYLGIVFEAGRSLNVDCSAIRRKFYAACNSVLHRCKLAPENVKLHLVQSHCLPLLMYCMGALRLSPSAIADISVCWNDSFRKIYGLNRWESVALVQLFTNSLPFKLMYHQYRWNFCDAAFLGVENTVPKPVKILLEIVKRDTALCIDYCAVYNYEGHSKACRRAAIADYFRETCGIRLS